ncbi:MAG: glycosyltransferase family 2 protein [Pseudomonadota bacterium]
MTQQHPDESRIPKIAIVLPCFNENESIRHAADQLLAIFADLIAKHEIASDSFLFFVDDGSKDDSWQILESIQQSQPAVKGLKLSRNFGHQAALLAGLMAVIAECDAAISIDADLQQDPFAITKFVAEFKRGADVVMGVRRDRGTDTWFKKQSATGFYTLMKYMGVKTIPNHADYRLLSRRALEALARFPEPDIFLRATCLQLGFRTSIVLFDVKERAFGTTKYSLVKMLRLAIHSITSFSVMPLRLVAVLGLTIFLMSVGMSGYVAWQALVVGDTIPGWASITLPIYFIGGIQLLCLGIVGEYIGHICQVVKKRPRWIEEKRI